MTRLSFLTFFFIGVDVLIVVVEVAVVFIIVVAKVDLMSLG
jgi:hypothetical protein